MAEHNAMVKKNFSDDTNATETRKDKIRVKYINTLNGSNSFAQTSDPLGKANETFIPSKAGAAKVVADQEAFEAAKTADVASRNAANTNAADTLWHHVSNARDVQSQGEAPLDNYPTRRNWTDRPAPAFVQTEESDPLGNSNKTFVTEKAAAADLVAKQQATEGANVSSIGAANDKSSSDASSHRAKVVAARDLQAAGDMYHDRFPW